MKAFPIVALVLLALLLRSLAFTVDCSRHILFAKMVEKIIGPMRCSLVLFIGPSYSPPTSHPCDNLDLAWYTNSTVLRASYDRSKKFHKPVPLINTAIHCIVMHIVDDYSLKGASSILELNSLTFYYDTEIAIVCTAECSGAGLTRGLEPWGMTTRDNLPNALVADYRAQRVLKVCASAKQVGPMEAGPEPYDCPVNFHGETLQISLTYNPPMTVPKNPDLLARDDPLMAMPSVDEAEGLEVELLRALMSSFNFTVVVDQENVANVTYVLRGDTIETEVSGLVSEDIRINGNVHPVETILNTNGTALYTWPTFSETSCIIIDTRLFPKPILNLYEIFSPEVYIGVIVILVVVTGVWIIIDRCLNDKRSSCGVIVLMVFSITHSGGAYRPLRTSSERILVSVFLFYNFVILSVFQDNLINVFNKLDEFKDYKTLESFIESGIPVLPFRHEVAKFYSLYKHLNHTTTKDYLDLTDRIEQALEMANFTDKPYFTTDFARYTSEGYAVMSTVSLAKRKVAESVKLNNGTTTLHILNIIPVPAHMNLVVHRQLKFHPQINKRILHLTAGDLFAVWQQRSVNDYNVQMISKYKKSKDIHTLDLTELQMCFFLYVYGVLFCVLVFAIEMIYWYYCTKLLAKRKTC